MSAILKTRVAGAWVNTSKKGAVRLGGSTIAFGPSSNPPQSLFTAGVDEPVGDFDEGSGLTLGTGMVFNTPGKVTHGRYRFPNTPIGTYTFVLYQSTGATTGTAVASATFGAGDIVAGGWGTVALSGGGYTISTGTSGSGTGYFAAVYTSAGRYVARGAYFTAPKTSGNIYAWQNNTNYLGDATRTNGNFGSGNVYPNGSFNSSCYYCDVVFVAS
jgi:hypothetical protein